MPPNLSGVAESDTFRTLGLVGVVAAVAAFVIGGGVVGMVIGGLTTALSWVAGALLGTLIGSKGLDVLVVLVVAVGLVAFIASDRDSADDLGIWLQFLLWGAGGYALGRLLMGVVV